MSDPKKYGCFESMWKGIIRPPRLTYSINDLGKDVWVLDNSVVRRFDFNVKNNRGLEIVGSYFEPMRVFDKPHQCVIYLHGNSSSRLEAMGILEFMIPYDIAVCGFDFSGCGQSEGEYVSLGYHEKEDVQTIYEWIRANKFQQQITTVGLWGRSMGSVTAILTTKIIPEIKVIVCDSPFSNLRFLCQKLAKQSYSIPSCLFSLVFCCIRRRIYQEAKFDVDLLNIADEIMSVDKSVSILFLSAKQDLLIDSSNPTLLYNLFKGYKRILYFEGNHNSRRPKDIHQLITRFFIERMDKQEAPLSKQSLQIITKRQHPLVKISMKQVQPKGNTPGNDESDPIIREIKVKQHTFVEGINTPQKL